ncbi:hypothetical protein N2152v2_003975 [Parachlorella kessleri]
MLDKAIRELDRERMQLQSQEKKLVVEIKKMASQGQMDAVRVMAKSMVRNRNAVNRMFQLKSQLQAVSLRIATLKSTQAMADAMRGATKAMGAMNRQMNLPAMQKIMMEFERQNEKMEMTSEMMGDAVDDVFEGADEEEETDNIVNQVLAEIGVNLDSELVAAPAKRVAQAAPQEVQPQAIGAAAGGGGGGMGGGGGGAGAVGGGGDPGLDDDLQARLDRLRKTAQPTASPSKDQSVAGNGATPPQNGATLPQQHAPFHHTQQPEQQRTQRPQQEEQQQQEEQHLQQPSFPQQLTGAQISVRNIGKKFRTRRGIFTAVEDVSVDMEAGTITALVGPSGSGKTTLLRLIAGLEEPTEGRVFFDGVDVTESRVQDRDLGVVFQGYALFKHMTVTDNIKFGPRIRKMDLDLDARAEELLRLIELGELGGRYPPQLSGGQKQRVAVARALASGPKVLLLDEPFGALDPQVRKSLREGLQAIVRRLGVTTILVTHDQEEAWDLADRVVIFNRGRVEQEGTPAEITEHPNSPFVMDFTGDTQHLPSTCQFVRRMGVTTDKPYVMCRPSHALILKVFPEEEPTICPASVADRVNMGWAVRYYLKFDDGVDFEFVVSRQEDEACFDLTVGSRVYVQVEPDRFMPFDYADIDSTPGGL